MNSLTHQRYDLELKPESKRNISDDLQSIYDSMNPAPKRRNDMGKTRQQLAILGVLLFGPIVGEWFKWQSDGISIRGRIARWALDADQATAAGYIHDFRYYVINITCKPHSLERKHYRQMADTELRWNVTRIGKGWTEDGMPVIGKGRLKGQLFGRMYGRAVRLRGHKALNAKILTIPMPPNIKALERVEEECKDLWEPNPIPKYGLKQLKTWKKQLEDK